VQVDDASADVRATFRNTEKYDVDDAPAYFEKVEIKLEIMSPAAANQVKRLAAHAERMAGAYRRSPRYPPGE